MVGAFTLASFPAFQSSELQTQFPYMLLHTLHVTFFGHNETFVCLRSRSRCQESLCLSAHTTILWAKTHEESTVVVESRLTSTSSSNIFRIFLNFAYLFYFLPIISCKKTQQIRGLAIERKRWTDWKRVRYATWVLSMTTLQRRVNQALGSRQSVAIEMIMLPCRSVWRSAVVH